MNRCVDVYLFEYKNQPLYLLKIFIYLKLGCEAFLLGAQSQNRGLGANYSKLPHNNKNIDITTMQIGIRS